VTWDRAGNIYVADGFGTNSRIAKFTRDGNFVKSWGQTGSGQGQFNRIKGIATDAAGNLYVADAGNNRIQVFDGEGTFKSQITGIGSPQAICISGGSTQYLYSSNSNDPESMDNGEIYKISLSGQVVGKFGKAGKMILSSGDEAATTVTRNIAREGAQTGSRGLPGNLVAKLPDGTVIMRTDEAGRIIPPPRQELTAVVGDARQSLDNAGAFQHRLEERALTITGERQIRSKKHAMMEGARLVFEQFEKLGG
jgi:DNA-binding beta-propeller fold protein YncE